MSMPKNLGRRAILAGVGMTLAGSVIAGTTDANASTGPVANAVTKSTKLADSNVSVRTSGHRISGRAAIKDTTSGNDFVAVQVSLQRWVNDHWITVVKGPRKTGNNYAVSTIGTRTCTAGRYYRAIANYNWTNRSRWSAATKPVTC
ncbi:MAG: hypothetical protein ACRDP6_47060 [Actinoallomurus sp.]